MHACMNLVHFPISHTLNRDRQQLALHTEPACGLEGLLYGTLGLACGVNMVEERGGWTT